MTVERKNRVRSKTYLKIMAYLQYAVTIAEDLPGLKRMMDSYINNLKTDNGTVPAYAYKVRPVGISIGGEVYQMKSIEIWWTDPYGKIEKLLAIVRP